MSDQLYKCPECGWVGTERDMDADYWTIYDEEGNWDDEVWSNWICPGCQMWHQLDDYEKVDPEPLTSAPECSTMLTPTNDTTKGNKMSSNANVYKQAIDVLMAGEYDAKAIIVELAKNYPTVFVRLAQSVKAADKVEPWQIAARAKMAAGLKVEAIKEIRAATGLGPKEAKDISDNVQNLMTSFSPSVLYYDNAAKLHDPQHVRWAYAIAGLSCPVGYGVHRS